MSSSLLSAAGVASSSASASLSSSHSNGRLMLLENMAAALLPASPSYVDHCELLSDWFGALVQFLLALVAFCSLLLKLYFEVPRRPFKIWLMDALKQGLGGLLAHAYNMLFAWVLVAASHVGQSECIYYFINYIVDAVFGCVLNYVLLMLCERVAKHQGWTTLQSGNYGKPASWAVWGWQFVQWLIIISVVKFALLYGFILPLQQPLYTTSDWMLEPVKPYPKFELMLVMIIIPFVANTIIFWVTDNFIMDSSTPRDPLPPSKDLFYDEYGYDAEAPSASAAQQQHAGGAETDNDNGDGYRPQTQPLLHEHSSNAKPNSSNASAAVASSSSSSSSSS